MPLAIMTLRRAIVAHDAIINRLKRAQGCHMLGGVNLSSLILHPADQAPQHLETFPVVRMSSGSRGVAAIGAPSRYGLIV